MGGASRSADLVCGGAKLWSLDGCNDAGGERKSLGEPKTGERPEFVEASDWLPGKGEAT